MLPRALEPDRFVSDSPRPLVRRLLRSWPLDEQRAFFERDLRIPLKLEDDTGKYFPVSDRARDIRDRLLAHADRAGVQFRFNTRLTDLTRQRRALGGADDIGPDRSGRRHHGDRRPIRARDRQRRRRFRSGGEARTHDPSDLSGADAADLRSRAACGALRHLARRPLAREVAAVRRSNRTAVSCSRITATADRRCSTSRTWPCAAPWPAKAIVRRFACGGSISMPPDGRRCCADAGGLVLTAVSRRLPGRLAERLLVESRVPLDRRASSTHARRTSGLDRTIDVLRIAVDRTTRATRRRK